MDIEQAVKIENSLKFRNGLKNIYNIENLIVLDASNNANQKLKKSVEELLPLGQNLPDDLKELWDNAFAKQVRQSVDRFKKKKE